MRIGYLDTSCLVAVAFEEPGAAGLARRLEGYDELLSSNLLEAEFLAALRREDVEGGEDPMDGVAWVLPDRRLTPELRRTLEAGPLRGAALWHVATALYLAETPSDVDFLTLDDAQRAVAADLGFNTPL